MKKFIFLLILIPVLLAFQNWEKPTPPATSSELRTLANDPLEPSKLFAASRFEIFTSSGNNAWGPLWQTGGPPREIQKIITFKVLPDSVFVLTRKGAFLGHLKERRWQEIYRGGTPPEQSVLSFTVSPQDPNRWFLGTESGLFTSADSGKNWVRFDYFSGEPVSILKFFKNQLWVATQNQLYVSDNLKDFKKVFSILEEGSDENSDTESTESASEEEVASQKIFSFYDLVIPQNPKEPIWLASRKGVFESQDQGKNWRQLPQSGLRDARISHLVYFQRLFAGTPNGIYVYSPANRGWQEIFGGLENTNIHGLILTGNKPPALAAVTDRGFYRLTLAPEILKDPPAPGFLSEKIPLLRQLIRLEPSAQQVQEAATRYNDLGGGKIKRWQMASRIRSVIPYFSIGKSLSRGSTIDSEKTSTYSPIHYVTGPDDVTKSWDLNINWNLGDLLWNSAQTSIDSRSKIDAEYRNNLLSELTRIYYERRRLQTEIALSPQEPEQNRFEKLIRLDELTALLDGMSGGYFSRELERVYKKNPGLATLWFQERNL